MDSPDDPRPGRRARRASGPRPAGGERPGFEGFAAAHGFRGPRGPEFRDADPFARAPGGDDAADRRGHDPLDGPGGAPGAGDFAGARTRAGASDDADELPPPRRTPGSPPRALPDLSVLLVILDAVRAAVPRELQAQFTALLREVLLAVRALIDRYLDRLDGRSTRSRVEDIPID